MATSPYGGFADLSPYRARVEQKYYAGTPEGKLAAAIQESILQKNLQASDPNSPENQLGLAIQQANLAKLQKPQVYNTGAGLAIEDLTTGGYNIVPGTAPQRSVKQALDPWSNPIATDQGLVQRNIITGDVRPFTMSGSPLQKSITPIKSDPNDPWGDPISTDQGMVQRNKLTGDFRAAQIQSGTAGERIPLTRTPASKKGSSEPSQASVQIQQERSRRNLDTISELRKSASETTTGLGSLLSKIPGTAAADFEANVDTLKANIAFSELQAMRDASKTGGALGQVAVRELELLQSALGALNPRQSKKSFLSNLDKIEKSVSRFDKAKDNVLSPVKNIEIPIIETQEEFDALPSGSQYVEEDGITYTKP